MPSSPIPDRFPERLLAWWDHHGRKELPWQNPRTPYRVWVSEIMLQQTQVAAVIPYFQRWMSRFPDLRTLASAPQDEVLSLWSGLGYYARGRNLHKAAGVCLERFDGRLPDTLEALTELPGIGPSTANAIISLAYDRPAVILDGNVRRVFARHAGIPGWPGSSRVQRQLWLEAESRLANDRAADYSQAIMDLGALVCTRHNPMCGACPVSAGCRARLLGATDRIPAPRPKKKVPSRELHMLVLRDHRGRILLQRRPPSGIWGGLWSLPEGKSRRAAHSSIGLSPDPVGARICSLPDFEHRLTHLRLKIKPLLVTLPPSGRLECRSLKEEPDTAWFSREDRATIGLPKPVNDLLETVENQP